MSCHFTFARRVTFRYWLLLNFFCCFSLICFQVSGNCYIIVLHFRIFVIRRTSRQTVVLKIDRPLVTLSIGFEHFVAKSTYAWVYKLSTIAVFRAHVLTSESKRVPGLESQLISSIDQRIFIKSPSMAHRWFITTFSLIIENPSMAKL